MDPRQPQQHPFSRNGASPYGRNSYPTNASQSSYPQSSHPSNAAPPPAYGGDHHRKPSDPPYSGYPQRQYSGDGALMSGGSHSRNQSASSIAHGTPGGRGMPPPSSPQQRETQQNNYGPPRGATASAGQPFSSGRELPALPPGRPASTAGGSMSIHSILGGPGPASREANPHYSPISTGGPPSSLYGGSTHASPRTTAAPDYASFRRPLTPEHQRSYESRDHRANSAGSPPGASGHYTPDTRRFGTPQNYGRTIPADERREAIRVPNPNSALPPRPSSQPGAYNAPPRLNEPRGSIHSDGIFGRRGPIDPLRVESISRDPYRRPDFEDRQTSALVYADRARQEREREATAQREREQRERVEQSNSMQQEYAHQLSQRNSQAYSRHAERESPWMRHGYEPPRHAYEPIPEQAPHQREPLPGHDYSPRTTAPPFSSLSAYPNEHRYPPSSQTASASLPQSSISAASQYELAIQERQERQERQKLALEREMQEQRQALFAQPQNTPYQTQESPTRRQLDDTQQISQLNVQRNQNHLTVQEMNRKGRVSPLPQAVQGAQGQISTPSGEPGIKSEFGRMFSGIGSGVGAMGAPSPVIAGHQSLPNSAQLRREDLDVDSPVENGGYKLARSPSRGGRRRKLKDEDGRDDDSSTGRRTPSGTGRGKRGKSHHYLHHNHHHRRADPLENTSSPSQSNITPFKNVSGALIPSPPDAKSAPVLHHHHVPRHHHHPPAKPAVPQSVITPLPKTTIRSNAVLEAVAHLPRRHLGHAYYQSQLKPTGINPNAPRSKRGFASTPQPLPNFEGSENCTFTIKVPAINLSQPSRGEITYRRAVWGTDVYTDDSDIVAACIHHGWFRGAWAPEIDVDLLDLEIGGPYATLAPEPSETEPPSRGPLDPPKNRDAHVTILVLPNLEKYASTTRFGIRSREWGAKRDGYKGTHDGLSFMILSVRWVNGVDDEVGRSAGARKKMVVRDMEEAMREDEEWSHMFNNANGKYRNINGAHISESFERGSTRVGELGPGEFSGVGMEHWWKAPVSAADGAVTAKEAKKDEKEEYPAQAPAPAPAPVKETTVVEKTDIERVTEKMVENAVVPTEASAAAPTPDPASTVTNGDGESAKGEAVDDVPVAA